MLKYSNKTESHRKDSFDREHLKSNIKHRSIRAGAVTVMSQAMHHVISTVGTIILARLLIPSDFGLVAMVAAVKGFAALFSDIGLSMATIQKKNITHEQISTLFWINVALGVLISASISALAPVIAWFFNEPRLILITIALASTFVFGGLTAQHQALLKRQMRFTALASIRISSVFLGLCVAVSSALNGAGYWSLVMMQITTALSILLGTWILSDWRPGRPTKKAGIKNMLKFGGNVTGFNVINFFARNLDNILIGRVWGAGSLGLYSKAYGLLMLPLKQINAPLASVAIPTLSTLADDPPKYQSYYLKMISFITFISTPLIVFFIICSDDIILLLLGEKWFEAGKIFSVLGIAALIQPLYHTQGQLHISSGRSDRFLKWGIVGSTITIIGFFIGLPFGPIGVAFSYAATTWINIIPCMWYAGNSAGIRLKYILSTVAKNYLAAFCSIFCSYLLISKFTFFDGTIGNLFSGFCYVASTYSVFILIFYRKLKPFTQVVDITRTVLFPPKISTTFEK